MEILHQIKDLMNPEFIIKGGVILTILVIFAETGLFIGFFLPGDSLLFAAGLFSRTGELTFNFPLFILFTTLAAIIGNFVGYFFGYYMGPKLFKKDDSLIFKKKYLDMTQSFYDRNGAPALILGRFVPIIRTFVPILAGAIHMNIGKFSLYNIVGAILWVPTLMTAGYLLGQIDWVKDNLEKIVIGLIIVTIIPVIRTYLRERKNHIRKSKEV